MQQNLTYSVPRAHQHFKEKVIEEEIGWVRRPLVEWRTEKYEWKFGQQKIYTSSMSE